jgi:nucleoid DNA-binding protein
MSGFGKFNAKAKVAGEERNPQTEEAVMLGAR